MSSSFFSRLRRLVRGAADNSAAAADEKPTADANDGKLTADAVDEKPTADANDEKPTADAADEKPTADAADEKPTADTADGKPTADANEPPKQRLAPKISDHQWLSELIEKVTQRDADALGKVGGSSFWDRMDNLRDNGDSRLAVQWLEKFSVAIPEGETHTLLVARAADIRVDRGELPEALPHLEFLTQIPESAAKAHFILAEHHQSQNNLHKALRHFESVLAIDMDYPKARVRATALRKKLGGARSARAGATVLGPSADTPGQARYHLLRELGRGSAGTVYVARDTELSRDVAVKLLHPHLLARAQAQARERSFSEARVAASLRHPNIIAILDLDEDKRRIVMELAAGGTLRDQLRKGALTPLLALRRHVDLLSALCAAHDSGVIHRDLKPANLLYRGDADDPDSELVLCDFGIAQLVPAVAAADRRVKPRGRDRGALGTLGYMAPEQRQGQQQDPAIDLYGSAVILHETLIGRLPWSQSIILRGLRRPGDLGLLPEFARSLEPELAEPLHQHLCTLGHPNAQARPATKDALAEARRLLAIAETVDLLSTFRSDRQAGAR